MVESLAERFDIVIHPAATALPDKNMVARHLHQAPFVLVSAPGAVPVIEDPMMLAQTDVIGWEYMGPPDRWHLVHADGRSVDVAVMPRLVSDNLLVMHQAVLAGWGVAPMSTLLCADDLAAGRLQLVLPGWSPPPATLYAVYASRRSLSMAGRVFINDLEAYLKQVYQTV